MRTERAILVAHLHGIARAAERWRERRLDGMNPRVGWREENAHIRALVRTALATVLAQDRARE